MTELSMGSKEIRQDWRATNQTDALRYRANREERLDLSVATFYADALDGATHPFYAYLSASAHLECARHPYIVGRENIAQRLERALEAAEAIPSPLEQGELFDGAYYRARLALAYLPKWQAQLVEQKTPTLEQEKVVLTSLLSLAQELDYLVDQLPPGMPVPVVVSNLRFQLMVHLLNARFNVRHGRVMQHVWPAMPRFVCMDWDLEIGLEDFCLTDLKVSARYNRNGHRLSRSVLALEAAQIAGSFTFKNFAKIMDHEMEDPLVSNPAVAILNQAEENLLTAIGWQIEEDAASA